MHKYAIGVASLPIATEIDDYPICLKGKLHDANRSTSSTRKATQCNQGISIDFGFIVQSSKDRERVRRLGGLHCETCYVLHTHSCVTILVTYFTVLLFAPSALPSSGSPNGLPDGPTVNSTYVRMYLGGELGRSRNP
jgi:hypothetical protein